MQCLRQFYHHIAKPSLLGLLLLTIGLTSCANPVQADSPVKPDLEKQVLEIIRKNPEVILESVAKYQREQQENQAKAREAVINKIASNPAAVVGKSPQLGQGKTILIEFSDFQCPYCAQAHENVKQFVKQRSADVTLVYKHLPLAQIHPEATSAAQAAWAAQQQNKFWEFHDALFENQAAIGPGLYQKIAKQLGLDVARFERDRISDAAKKAIAADLELASSMELNGTPSFIMNGQLFSGAVPVAELEQRLTQK
jgi:protein-disulfide isomerase